MSQANLNFLIPYPSGTKGVSVSNATLDATGEEYHVVGHIMLQNGAAGGSKTISSAGGKIHARFGATTFANAGTTIRVGIGAVSTTLNPTAMSGSPAATPDVYDELVGATDTITSSTIKTITMSTGTKTITDHDLVAISFNMVSRAGADSVLVATNTDSHTANFSRPAGSLYLAAAWTKTSQIANVLIEFDDGTFGWIEHATELQPPHSSTGSVTTAFNSSTGTADEYGNLINFKTYSTIHGARLSYSPDNAAADFELILYSDPLGTPVAERTLTVDATQTNIAAATSNAFNGMFPTAFLASPNTDYAICVRPTTTTSLTLYGYDHVPVDVLLMSGVSSDKCYAVRRLDNTGAFSDTNGGTAKSRRYFISALIGAIPDDRSASQSQIGLY